jgi:uncharacterized protein (UPF0548 family)
LADEGRFARPEIRRKLVELADRNLNFDPRSLEDLAPEHAWHHDDYRRDLPSEPPGPPVAGGSFETARRLMSDYEFADPGVVRAIYDPEAPLEGRNLLLEIRFWALRFYVGVRVCEVRDTTQETEGRRARIWGWGYRTLAGHLEKGQMDYEVRKWQDTGKVEFRIHAISEMARIRNPLVRIGFRLFGRREQVKFARRCGERLAALTAATLEHGAEAEPRPVIVGGLVVSPTDAIATPSLVGQAGRARRPRDSLSSE